MKRQPSLKVTLIDIFGRHSTGEFSWESKLVECKLKNKNAITFSLSHFILISFVRNFLHPGDM